MFVSSNVEEKEGRAKEGGLLREIWGAEWQSGGELVAFYGFTPVIIAAGRAKAPGWCPPKAGSPVEARPGTGEN